ncbi:MAG TPA: amylo-alpha-1,6-glucosidase [Terriglobales bacterium]|nr:amylo-alpha-1,6-glucosidase [Terriglobales bacterium]
MTGFDESVCGDLPSATRREWLEANGLGGFASSTIPGLNTRRYHGLLVAATRPPVGRVLLLSKLEETLVVGGERYELSANQYPDAIHPQGYRLLRSFRLDPWPVWVYEAGGARLLKRVFMVHGENTTVVQYALLAPVGAPRLELRPLVAFRDFHSTTHENAALDGSVTPVAGGIRLQLYPGLPALYLAHNASTVTSECLWYRRFQYERERERGLDFEEDLFNPCVLLFDLLPDAAATVIASTSSHQPDEAESLAAQELARRKRVAAARGPADETQRRLAPAADPFLVARGERHSILAGYPWFADWGRDSMIALPGLTLVTRRFDLARSILEEFSRLLDQGMLPNCFPDSSEPPQYNTADATLWFFQAVRAYLEASRDWAFVRDTLYPALLEILAWHRRGTRYGIRVEEETGLLHAGAPGVQLTWMDARIGDWVVTPRAGKPVEIQALWYNALRVLEELAQRAGDEPSRALAGRLAVQARSSFQRLFWNQRECCLYDVVDTAPDPSLRPNQIFAVSLPYPLLEPARARQVVDTVERHLLTPYGLRTLAPSDPRYLGRYQGDTRARDAAYHQGSVWPWLMGPFVTAYAKVHAGEPGLRERVESFLQPLVKHMDDAGLGQVSELFDGDPPHTARGCVAQAWSLAALLTGLDSLSGIR